MHPNHVVPEGKMRVVGIKAKKISSTKAVLIVKYISPPSKKMSSWNISVTTPLEGSTDDGIRIILHQPSSIHSIPAGTALVDCPLGLGIRSPPHNDSVAIHLFRV